MRHFASTFGFRVCFVFLVSGFGFSSAFAATAKDLLSTPLTVQGRPDHPTVYLTKADLARARYNRDHFPWAKQAADALLKRADIWANKSDDELTSLVPKPGACFAYGFSSCPLCGAQNSWWGATGCSLDDPGHVRCPNGHRMPDADHPDPGTGWTDKTGKIFYFVGTYNSYVSEQLLLALNDLSHAYALTNDDKYGHKAALLLDHLARVYPTCTKGSWDYPSTPPSGRFNRPWYQVARTLIQYTDDYDILMNGPHLAEPSSAKGLTRRQNIEQNLILNGARYCFEQSVLHPSLNNGQCDYIRGTLVAGVALGIPQYIAWGTQGPTSILNMVENNIDRDGQYYETSSLYSHHSRYLYLDTAELLNHYTDADHPHGIHLSTHPKLRAFALFPQSRTQLAGLQPTLGDDAPNLKPSHTPLPNPEDLDYLHHLYALAPTDADRRDIAQLILSSTPDLNAARATFKDPTWLLFHADDLSPHQQATSHTPQALTHPLTNTPLDSSDLLTQRNLALLRSPTGTALSLRAGPTLNHGHLDELNLNLFAFHQDLTYDIGYGLGSTHTQVGWAHTTASHNTVLVDETPQLATGNSKLATASGGCVTDFLSTPHLQLACASDPNAYASQHVTTYARTLALVDFSDTDAYAIDLFRVAGGHQHDYVFHARSTDVTTSSPLSDPAPGSLAGPTIDYLPQITPDGDLLNHPNHPYWNPPPGNGLGFLHAPRTALIEDKGQVIRGKGQGKDEVSSSLAPRPLPLAPSPSPFSATWHIDPKTHLTLTLLPTPDTTYLTATAPGILPGKFPQSTYLYARRSLSNSKSEISNPSLSSTFVATIEPHRKPAPHIKSVTNLLPPPTSATSPVALKISLPSGRTDYFLQATTEPLSTTDGPTKLSLQSGTAHLSVTPDLTTLTLSSCPSLTYNDLTIQMPSSLTGTLSRVDYATSTLYTTTPLPDGPLLANTFLILSNPAYTRPTTYRIASITRENNETAIHLAPTSLILARPHLSSAPHDAHTLPNIIPLEYAKAVTHRPTRFFDGKTLSTPDGHTSTTIRSVDGAQGTTLTVDDATPFPPDTDLLIYDTRPGDKFEIPTHAIIHLTQDNHLSTQSPVPLEITHQGHSLTTTPSSTLQPINDN